MLLSKKQKNEAVFMFQEGYSIEFIAESLNCRLPYINFVLKEIYLSDNDLFLVKSISEEGIYYMFCKNIEKRLISKEERRIWNEWDFTHEEKFKIEHLYGFKKRW